MMIPTEPIGSIPRPPALVAAWREGRDPAELALLAGEAVRATIAELEALGCPVVSDGEQAKFGNFWCYPVDGAPNMAPDGFHIPLAGGHGQRMPRLVRGPLRYQRYADEYLSAARRHATQPVKQAVISPSALSLIYPAEGIADYPREHFLDDLVREHETEVRRCLEAGAHKVQIDFAHARLAMQLDPGGALLSSFIDLDNLALGRFSPEQRALIGVHVSAAPWSDGASALDAEYAELLPALFELRTGNVYLSLAGSSDPARTLRIVRDYARPEQRIFVGVTDPSNPQVETPEQVRDRVLFAADFIAPERLGTTDDSGFAPFFDDAGLGRATAFAKIRARVEGTRLASAILGGAP
ncbi:5-methyltetrahydropteroyltriglutamate--homocysteine methyltransferase [Massilia sp. KIM]|uniref:5-methyltetrahydropteroyltriglutamate-- homocysteine methyltransferase n=1 Tax=Massilia sp. KIM TaxID=1955422 RepID=UPI00098F6E57|nr:5-methyltetrahydropteroyltriglutamate--homocysteine methyltransferase [Massilia sp. KIM]OON63371.1 5-methyltetrahydropteroyltriglutamate--homocysteine methyltransferase [Massilia sp. KIM]